MWQMTPWRWEWSEGCRTRTAAPLRETTQKATLLSETSAAARRTRVEAGTPMPSDCRRSAARSCRCLSPLTPHDGRELNQAESAQTVVFLPSLPSVHPLNRISTLPPMWYNSSHFLAYLHECPPSSTCAHVERAQWCSGPNVQIQLADEPSHRSSCPRLTCVCVCVCQMHSVTCYTYASWETFVSHLICLTLAVNHSM